MEYTKIRKNDIVYYVQNDLLGQVVVGLIEYPSSDRPLMLFSDFVVDIRTNKILKCRVDLEEVFDKLTGLK